MHARSKNLPAEERRAATVEAVVELAGSQDPSTITTAAIAKRMNLTQGALFRHFSSKDAIWHAVLEWGTEQLMDRIKRGAFGLSSPLAAMEAMFLSHAGFVAEHPGIPKIMFGELQRAKSTPARRIAKAFLNRYGELLREFIEKGKACGELADDLDTEAASILFIGTIQGLVMQSMLAGNIARIRSDAPRVFAIFRRGIRSDR